MYRGDYLHQEATVFRHACNMNSDQLFKKVCAYTDLSETSRKSWQKLLREEAYRRGEYFIELGQVPEKVGFVFQGLFSQNYISESGDTTIKYFLDRKSVV